jgi:hypothetical protein
VSHYTAEDRARLAPAKRAVLDAMLGKGWLDLDSVARQTGVRVGTIASKLREICDSRHAFLGLTYDRQRGQNGVHFYRLRIAEPEQLPLLEAVNG